MKMPNFKYLQTRQTSTFLFTSTDSVFSQLFSAFH